MQGAAIYKLATGPDWFVWETMTCNAACQTACQCTGAAAQPACGCDNASQHRCINCLHATARRASAFFKVYLILFNAPGTDVTSEHTMPALIIANIIFITGILVFAVLLGMVGEEVRAGPPDHFLVFALVLGMVGEEVNGVCCAAWHCWGGGGMQAVNTSML